MINKTLVYFAHRKNKITLNKHNRMIAILTFNTDEPEDRELFRQACDAGNLHNALYEISQLLRTKTKHEEHTEEVYAEIEKIRDAFYEILNDNRIKL